MRLAAVMAIAACAPGCELVFPLDDPPNLIAHVPTADETINDNDITLADITIDTTQAAVTVGVPMGVVDLSVIDQEGQGPSMAILRGRAITISGALRIEGSRPLVILGDTIRIDAGGSIDASAIGIRPGPGGHKSGEGGLGEGGPGGRSGDPLPTGSDSGGGGGAFGAIGAAPGAPVGDDCRAPQTGGRPGESFGDEALAVLDGGGAGGRGSGGCEDNVSLGGGGGGAIQLSALTSISIEGTIDAGGGGGEGGRARTSPAACQLNAGSGAGGGAGGAIFLEAPTIENLGTVAANGGGGGGGPKEEASADAMPGSDASANALAATGGPGQSPEGGNGGNGAAMSAATPGGQGQCANLTTKVNGGGGGGGAGRIVMRGSSVLKGMTSPLPNVVTP